MMNKSGPFPGSGEPGIRKIVKQPSQKEIAADALALRLHLLDKLDDEKAEFMADHKRKKEDLETEIRNFTAIIRNYTPVFEEVDTGTGEIRDSAEAPAR